MVDERTSANDRIAPLRPAIELTERQRTVLRAVVEDYVMNAVPVGSKALVDRYRLFVSSATVRSAMAELEMLGLLHIPAPAACHRILDIGSTSSP